MLRITTSLYVELSQVVVGERFMTKGRRQMKIDVQVKQDIIEDLLTGFEWAFGLSMTEQERDKFRKARDIEWQSGDATWQFPLVKIYRRAIVEVWGRKDHQADFQTGVASALNDPLYRNITQFDLNKTSVHIEEKEWLTAWVKRGKPLGSFVVSKAKRASYEKEDSVIATTERPNPYAAIAGGATTTVELRASYLVKAVESFNTRFSVGLSVADREELARRTIEDWKKNGEIGLRDYQAKSAIQCFLLSDVFFSAKAFFDFIKAGDKDGKWLEEKANKSTFWLTPIPSEREAGLMIFRDYAAYRICQVNQIAGQDIVPLTSTVKAKIVERIINQWGTFSAEKKKEILGGTKLFSSHQNLWQFQVPLIREYQCHLWGQDLVKSAPELKPIVDKRATYFNNLAKKDPNWKAKADMSQKQLEQSIVQMQGEYLRGQTQRMKAAMDDLVKSSHVLNMNILENAKTGPAETYWYLKRINP
jgi:hypothetical protein